jgi:hypothetical protein
VQRAGTGVALGGLVVGGDGDQFCEPVLSPVAEHVLVQEAVHGVQEQVFTDRDGRDRVVGAGDRVARVVRGVGAPVVHVDAVRVSFGRVGAADAVHAVLAGVAADAGAEGVAAAGLSGAHLQVAYIAAFGGHLLGGLPGRLIDQGAMHGLG